MNVWYEDYDVWLTLRDCFISTPELTMLFDDAQTAYAEGDHELFFQMHSQIAQYMPDQFGPCMDNPEVEDLINQFLGLLDTFISLQSYLEVAYQNYLDRQWDVDQWGAQMIPAWATDVHNWEAGQLYGLMTQVVFEVPTTVQVSNGQSSSSGQTSSSGQSDLCGSLVYTAYFDDEA